MVDALELYMVGRLDGRMESNMVDELVGRLGFQRVLNKDSWMAVVLVHTSADEKE